MAAIAAGGPSLRKDELEALRGLVELVVINRSVELAPWASVWYAADLAWWERWHAYPFEGERWTQSDKAAEQFGLNKVTRIEGTPSAERPGFHLGDAGLVHGAGASGFQATNMVLNWQPDAVLLLGFDNDPAQPSHWHGAHEKGLNNPDRALIEQWGRAWATVRPQLDELPCPIINCNPASKISVFPQKPLSEALDDLGL